MRRNLVKARQEWQRNRMSAALASGATAKEAAKASSLGTLAALAGVTTASIRHWELGDGFPNTRKLSALAAILGRSIDELIEDS